MKRSIVLLVYLLVISVILPPWSRGSEIEAPITGEGLPHFELPLPMLEAHVDYLGITGKSIFTISDIDAEVLIIEIFSMYCPHCQREASKINRLYKKINEFNGNGEKIKIIGIGVGNSDFEVGYFRKTYKIEFPLFSDPAFKLHKKFGEVRTPYFIGVKINKQKSNSIFYSKLGAFLKADRFLEMIIEKSGLKQMEDKK